MPISPDPLRADTLSRLLREWDQERDRLMNVPFSLTRVNADIFKELSYSLVRVLKIVRDAQNKHSQELDADVRGIMQDIHFTLVLMIGIMATTLTSSTPSQFLRVFGSTSDLAHQSHSVDELYTSMSQFYRLCSSWILIHGI